MGERGGVWLGVIKVGEWVVLYENSFCYRPQVSNVLQLVFPVVVLLFLILFL